MPSGFERVEREVAPAEDAIRIGIVGRGNFASSLTKHYGALESVDPSSFKDAANPAKITQPEVIIHAGSGRQLPGTFVYAAERDIPFIQAATSTTGSLPEKPGMPLVVAPNLALRIIRLIERLPEIARQARKEGFELSIEETHQVGKKTPPGTALLMAKILGIPESSIRSVRQIEAMHSGHRVMGTKGDEVKEYANDIIFGHQEYAEGGLDIARRLVANRTRLANRIYTPAEILRMPASSGLKKGHR